MINSQVIATDVSVGNMAIRKFVAQHFPSAVATSLAFLLRKRNNGRMIGQENQKKTPPTQGVYGGGGVVFYRRTPVGDVFQLYHQDQAAYPNSSFKSYAGDQNLTRIWNASLSSLNLHQKEKGTL